MDRDERNMKAMGSCSRVVVGLISVLGASSCAQVIGADDYRLAQGGGTGGAPDEPITPFLTAPACESCVEGSCASELSLCLEDAECSSWLADVRNDPHPSSAYARDLAMDEVLWRRHHVGDSTPIASDELSQCVERACLKDCQYGQDFRCVDAFDWDVPYPTDLRVRARHYTGNLTKGGWNVHACQARDRCAQPLTPPVPTDAGGFATLELGSGDSPVGSLRFIAPTGFVPWEVSVTRPFASGDYSAWGFIDDATIQETFHQFVEDFDSAHGLIMVVPMDCAGFNAKQVSVEAWLDTPNGVEKCTECRIAYEDASYKPQFTPPELSTKGRQVYVGLAPPRLVHVVVRRSRPPGTVVSVASIAVKAGEGHIVRTYPASMQERETFPY